GRGRAVASTFSSASRLTKGSWKQAQTALTGWGGRHAGTCECRSAWGGALQQCELSTVVMTATSATKGETGRLRQGRPVAVQMDDAERGHVPAVHRPGMTALCSQGLSGERDDHAALADCRRRELCSRCRLQRSARREHCTNRTPAATGRPGHESAGDCGPSRWCGGCCPDR